jgi:hypothetical protein
VRTIAAAVRRGCAPASCASAHVSRLAAVHAGAAGPALTGSISPPIRHRGPHFGSNRPAWARPGRDASKGGRRAFPRCASNGESSRRSPQHGACGSVRFCLCR